MFAFSVMNIKVSKSVKSQQSSVVEVCVQNRKSVSIMMFAGQFDEVFHG